MAPRRRVRAVRRRRLAVASEIREQTVAALASADLLPGLELDALAGAEHAHLDLGRRLLQRLDELERREVDEAGLARQAEVDREVRAPVDRDDEPGLDAGDRLRGALRIEMAAPRDRAPSPRSG